MLQSLESVTTGGTSHASSDGQSKQSADPNRIEEILPNGTKVIRYKNGTLKEVDPSGSSIVRFLNGDSKQYKADSGVVVYYYALADTNTHTPHTRTDLRSTSSPINRQAVHLLSC